MSRSYPPIRRIRLVVSRPVSQSRSRHGAEDLSETLRVLLELLKTHMNVVRAMVSLFEPGSGNIFIHESFGLSEEEQAKGVYFL